MEKVELSIDRYTYYVSRDRVNAFPNSYFAVALRPHWNSNTEGESGAKLRIEGRSVELFEHIVNFINFGCIPRGSNGDCLIDRKLLPALREEADYFCLQELVDEIDGLCSVSLLNMGLKFHAASSRRRRHLTIGVDMTSKEEHLSGFFRSDSRNFRMFKDLATSFAALQYSLPFAIVGATQWLPPIKKGVGSININTMIKEWQDKPLDQRYWNICLHRKFLASIATYVKQLVHSQYSISMLFVSAHVNASDIQNKEEILAHNIGYLWVVVPTKRSGGLELKITNSESNYFTVKTSDVISTDTDISENKHNKCMFIITSLDSNLEFPPTAVDGQCLLLKYKINIDRYEMYRVQRYAAIATNPVNILNVVEQSTKQFDDFNALLFSIISQVGYVGIILVKDYVSEGLRADSLVGFDATLYAKMISMGVPVSLVHAVRDIEIVYRADFCTEEFTSDKRNVYDIRLLDNATLDTRLPIHKTKRFRRSKVPFISIDQQSGVELSYTSANPDSDGLIYSNRKSIVATMIIGSGKITCKISNTDND